LEEKYRKGRGDPRGRPLRGREGASPSPTKSFGGALHKMLDRKGKEIILRMGRREIFHRNGEGNSQPME